MNLKVPFRNEIMTAILEVDEAESSIEKIDLYET